MSRANCYAERLVLTVRTELTDRMLIFGERTLPLMSHSLFPTRFTAKSGVDLSSAGSSTTMHQLPEPLVTGHGQILEPTGDNLGHLLGVVTRDDPPTSGRWTRQLLERLHKTL